MYNTYICIFVFDCAVLCYMLGDEVYSHYSPIHVINSTEMKVDASHNSYRFQCQQTIVHGL